MKKRWSFIILVMIICLIGGCSHAKEEPLIQDKYRNYYEIFVYSFCDSNGDGIGDLNGVTSKLDYLVDLGIDGIWLTPIMPSDTTHKYNVEDYMAIDSTFGTMEDFDRLMEECNKRGINVILDLVVNHTSTKHPWFLKALDEVKAGKPGKYADYYSFVQDEEEKNSLDDEGGYHSAGIGNYMYEYAFTDNMAALNLENKEVVTEINNIAKYWLDKGVAGFRLDAVRHYCFDQAKSINFLKEFYKYCQTINPEVYMVGEVFSSGSMIETFYETDIDSYFNFMFAKADGRITSNLRGRAGADFVQSLYKWQERISKVKANYIDANFLSNHDTDRYFGVIGKDNIKQKMAASMYLMMPGNSFTYYGEEIGMLGSGHDANKRAPMVWSTESGEEMTTPIPESDNIPAIEKGVKEQEKEKDSLFAFYKKALHIRQQNPEIARGRIEPIELEDKQMGAYTTTYNDSKVIIIHNLGDQTKTITLDTSTYDYSKIQDSLLTGNEKATLKGSEITLPPMSTVILK